MRKALVVLSGGQDSTTCLFWANKHYDEVHAISFDYGQVHSLELGYAKRNARAAGCNTHEVVSIPNVLKSTSPLIDRKAVLNKYESFNEMEKRTGDSIEDTFVPLRNPFFALIAANHAVSIGATDIILGICASDNANYPDCTHAFVSSMQVLINVSLGINITSEKAIKIVTPLVSLDKKGICQMAWDLGANAWEALACTLTSYDGKYPPTDNNHSNVLRAHGFEEAGLCDPLVVRAWHDELMDLPETENYNRLRAYYEHLNEFAKREGKDGRAIMNLFDLLHDAELMGAE